MIDFAKKMQNEVKMLLEFKTKNYKSFVEELSFSMLPAPKQKDLETSLLKEKIGGKEIKALSSAVIYGPNASGKSNIISAMDTFKSIVLRGNIKNGTISEQNVAASALELIPNYRFGNDKPTKFYIKFVENNMIFEYSLIFNIGVFLKQNDLSKRKILNETLYINNTKIYTREEKNVSLGEDLKKLEKYIFPTAFENQELLNVFVQNSLNDFDLFLNNGFKSLVSSQLTTTIVNWFEKNLIIIYDSNNFESGIDIKLEEYKDKKSVTNEKMLFVPEVVEKVAQYLGLNSNHIGYTRYNDSDKVVLCSMFNNNDIKAVIPAEIIESMGTIRFINLFLPLFTAMLSGHTIIIDEFDNSLHPMVIMSIINIFHNCEININKAQLIFNTHNPIFLNADLFRRDEIKFVERDESGSIHYSLSDFTFSNKNKENCKVRKGADYMKNYFVNRYGAIRNIDFSPIFEDAVKLKPIKLKKV